MLTRETILPEEKESFDGLVSHVLQSWEWGEFREKTGVRVIRPGVFKNNKLVSAYQLTIHSVPHTSYTIGYLPRSPEPDRAMLEVLKDIGEKYNTIFLKLEPNIEREDSPKFPFKLQTEYPNFLLSPRPLFTKHTFHIDLTESEEELMAQMKEKTRYNVRLAQKYGVEVREDNSPEAFETYLRLTRETTHRQSFYAHTEGYHRLMWQTLQPAGIAHLLVASYQGQMLATWILFSFNQILYYPYGASTGMHREVMASNLMMWEAERFGKKLGCHTLDLWGALGHHPDTTDPWYGFHRFKEGYGGRLVEFVGTYDFVLKPKVYKLYNFADNLRWKALKSKAKLTERLSRLLPNFRIGEPLL